MGKFVFVANRPTYSVLTFPLDPCPPHLYSNEDREAQPSDHMTHPQLLSRKFTLAHQLLLTPECPIPLLRREMFIQFQARVQFGDSTPERHSQGESTALGHGAHPVTLRGGLLHPVLFLW